MKISNVAAECGLSIHTIRYYEEIGICPAINRGADGNRCFSAENLDWLTLLAALRDTGMPIEKMKRFAALYKQGDDAVLERKQLLQEHQTALDIQQTQLDRCKTLVLKKLSIYDDMLGRKT